MKKVLLIISIIGLLISCGGNQHLKEEVSNEPEIVVEEVTNEIVEEPKLLKEQGNFIMDYDYNLVLKKKKLSPKNLMLSDSLLIVNGKDDKWIYKIIEEKESTPETYHILVNGGHSTLDEPQDYEFVFNEGIVVVKRLSNGASWFYINESARLSFEQMLESEGLIFHK